MNKGMVPKCDHRGGETGGQESTENQPHDKGSQIESQEVVVNKCIRDERFEHAKTTKRIFSDCSSETNKSSSFDDEFCNYTSSDGASRSSQSQMGSRDISPTLTTKVTKGGCSRSCKRVRKRRSELVCSLENAETEISRLKLELKQIQDRSKPKMVLSSIAVLQRENSELRKTMQTNEKEFRREIQKQEIQIFKLRKQLQDKEGENKGNACAIDSNALADATSKFSIVQKFVTSVQAAVKQKREQQRAAQESEKLTLMPNKLSQAQEKIQALESRRWSKKTIAAWSHDLSVNACDTTTVNEPIEVWKKTEECLAELKKSLVGDDGSICITDANRHTKALKALNQLEGLFIDIRDQHEKIVNEKEKIQIKYTESNYELLKVTKERNDMEEALTKEIKESERKAKESCVFTVAGEWEDDASRAGSFLTSRNESMEQVRLESCANVDTLSDLDALSTHRFHSIVHTDDEEGMLRPLNTPALDTQLDRQTGLVLSLPSSTVEDQINMQGDCAPKITSVPNYPGYLDLSSVSFSDIGRNRGWSGPMTDRRMNNGAYEVSSVGMPFRYGQKWGDLIGYNLSNKSTELMPITELKASKEEKSELECKENEATGRSHWLIENEAAMTEKLTMQQENLQSYNTFMTLKTLHLKGAKKTAQHRLRRAKREINRDNVGTDEKNFELLVNDLRRRVKVLKRENRLLSSANKRFRQEMESIRKERRQRRWMIKLRKKEMKNTGMYNPCLQQRMSQKDILHQCDKYETDSDSSSTVEGMNKRLGEAEKRERILLQERLVLRQRADELAAVLLKVQENASFEAGIDRTPRTKAAVKEAVRMAEAHLAESHERAEDLDNEGECVVAFRRHLEDLAARNSALEGERDLLEKEREEAENFLQHLDTKEEFQCSERRPFICRLKAAINELKRSNEVLSVQKAELIEERSKTKENAAKALASSRLFETFADDDLMSDSSEHGKSGYSDVESSERQISRGFIMTACTVQAVKDMEKALKKAARNNKRLYEENIILQRQADELAILLLKVQEKASMNFGGPRSDDETKMIFDEDQLRSVRNDTVVVRNISIAVSEQLESSKKTALVLEADQKTTDEFPRTLADAQEHIQHLNSEDSLLIQHRNCSANFFQRYAELPRRKLASKDGREAHENELGNEYNGFADCDLTVALRERNRLAAAVEYLQEENENLYEDCEDLQKRADDLAILLLKIQERAAKESVSLKSDDDGAHDATVMVSKQFLDAQERVKGLIIDVKAKQEKIDSLEEELGRAVKPGQIVEMDVSAADQGDGTVKSDIENDLAIGLHERDVLAKTKECLTYKNDNFAHNRDEMHTRPNDLAILALNIHGSVAMQEISSKVRAEEEDSVTASESKQLMDTSERVKSFEEDMISKTENIDNLGEECCGQEKPEAPLIHMNIGSDESDGESLINIREQLEDALYDKQRLEGAKEYLEEEVELLSAERDDLQKRADDLAILLLKIQERAAKEGVSLKSDDDGRHDIAAMVSKQFLDSQERVKGLMIVVKAKQEKIASLEEELRRSVKPGAQMVVMDEGADGGDKAFKSDIENTLAIGLDKRDMLAEAKECLANENAVLATNRDEMQQRADDLVILLLKIQERAAKRGVSLTDDCDDENSLAAAESKGLLDIPESVKHLAIDIKSEQQEISSSTAGVSSDTNTHMENVARTKQIIDSLTDCATDSNEVHDLVAHVAEVEAERTELDVRRAEVREAIKKRRRKRHGRDTNALESCGGDMISDVMDSERNGSAGDILDDDFDNKSCLDDEVVGICNKEVILELEEELRLMDDKNIVLDNKRRMLRKKADEIAKPLSTVLEGLDDNEEGGKVKCLVNEYLNSCNSEGIVLIDDSFNNSFDLERELKAAQAEIRRLVEENNRLAMFSKVKICDSEGEDLSTRVALFDAKRTELEVRSAEAREAIKNGRQRRHRRSQNALESGGGDMMSDVIESDRKDSAEDISDEAPVSECCSVHDIVVAADSLVPDKRLFVKGGNWSLEVENQTLRREQREIAGLLARLQGHLVDIIGNDKLRWLLDHHCDRSLICKAVKNDTTDVELDFASDGGTLVDEARVSMDVNPYNPVIENVLARLAQVEFSNAAYEKRQQRARSLLGKYHGWCRRADELSDTDRGKSRRDMVFSAEVVVESDEEEQSGGKESHADSENMVKDLHHQLSVTKEKYERSVHHLRCLETQADDLASLLRTVHLILLDEEPESADGRSNVDTSRDETSKNISAAPISIPNASADIHSTDLRRDELTLLPALRVAEDSSTALGLISGEPSTVSIQNTCENHRLFVPSSKALDWEQVCGETMAGLKERVLSETGLMPIDDANVAMQCESKSEAFSERCFLQNDNLEVAKHADDLKLYIGIDYYSLKRNRNHEKFLKLDKRQSNDIAVPLDTTRVRILGNTEDPYQVVSTLNMKAAVLKQLRSIRRAATAVPGDYLSVQQRRDYSQSSQASDGLSAPHTSLNRFRQQADQLAELLRKLQLFVLDQDVQFLPPQSAMEVLDSSSSAHSSKLQKAGDVIFRKRPTQEEGTEVPDVGEMGDEDIVETHDEVIGGELKTCSEGVFAGLEELRIIEEGKAALECERLVLQQQADDMAGVPKSLEDRPDDTVQTGMIMLLNARNVEGACKAATVLMEELQKGVDLREQLEDPQDENKRRRAERERLLLLEARLAEAESEKAALNLQREKARDIIRRRRQRQRRRAQKAAMAIANEVGGICEEDTVERDDEVSGGKSGELKTYSEDVVVELEEELRIMQEHNSVLEFERRLLKQQADDMAGLLKSLQDRVDGSVGLEKIKPLIAEDFEGARKAASVLNGEVQKELELREHLKDSQDEVMWLQAGRVTESKKGALKVQNEGPRNINLEVPSNQKENPKLETCCSSSVDEELFVDLEKRVQAPSEENMRLQLRQASEFSQEFLASTSQKTSRGIPIASKYKGTNIYQVEKLLIELEEQNKSLLQEKYLLQERADELAALLLQADVRINGDINGYFSNSQCEQARMEEEIEMLRSQLHAAETRSSALELENQQAEFTKQLYQQLVIHIEELTNENDKLKNMYANYACKSVDGNSSLTRSEDRSSSSYHTSSDELNTDSDVPTDILSNENEPDHVNVEAVELYRRIAELEKDINDLNTSRGENKYMHTDNNNNHI